jgi:hypothetical protein
MFSRFHQLFLQNQDFAIIFFGVFWFLLLFLFSFFLSCLKLYYFSKMIKRNKSRLNRRLNSGLEFAWFLGVWIVQHFCPSFSVKMSIGQPICCFSCFFSRVFCWVYVFLFFSVFSFLWYVFFAFGVFFRGVLCCVFHFVPCFWTSLRNSF